MNQIGDLVEDCDGGRVGAEEGLLVHADHAGIEVGHTVLGLRKKHHLAAGAHRVHRGLAVPGDRGGDAP